MRIITIYESVWYLEDNEFETEEEKIEFYEGEFWIYSDYIVIPGKNSPIQFRVDDKHGEIIVDAMEIDDVVHEILTRFAMDDFQKYFDEITVGNDFKKEEDPLYDESKPYLKYRGGSGYYYYHHQYKFNV